MPERAKTRVSRGVALLDAQVPGWAARVSLDALDISRDRVCILGQLFGGVPADGLAVLGVTRLQAVRNGFMEDHADKGNAVEARWREVITERRDREVAKKSVGKAAKKTAKKRSVKKAKTAGR